MTDHRGKTSSGEKIQILLQEYTSLRSEIINRNGNMHQLLAVGGTLFLWIMSRSIDVRLWASLGVALAVVFIFGWFEYHRIPTN